MFVKPISSQSFQAENKFRLPIEATTYDRWGSNIYDLRILPEKYVREYSNPKAEELYNQAQKAIDWREKARLYQEMGEYKLVAVSRKARFEKLWKKLFKL